MSVIAWIVVIVLWILSSFVVGMWLFSAAFTWRQRVCEHPMQYPLRRCANCWVCADCYREFHQAEGCGFNQHESRS